MSKSEQAFRTISEAAEILNLPAHVLRFWESKFKYIKPMKRGGGRRYYRPEDIQLLLGIKQLLYTEGLTIKGALKEIKNSGVKEIVRRGSIQIYDQKNEVTASQNVEINLETRLPTKSLDLQNKKIIDGANPEKLQNILDNLRRIQNRMRDRYNKKLVA